MSYVQDWIEREINDDTSPNNGYRIVEWLAKGATGYTFKARRLFTPRDFVALKILPQTYMELTPEAKSRFDREIGVLEHLNNEGGHPHIVGLLDKGVYRRMPYLVTEYKDGGNLKQLIERSELNYKTALHLFKPIAEALDFMHQQGIIHRDLKPENILLQKRHADQGYEPYIADFGMATIRDGISVTKAGDRIGTYNYMAPEMWESGVTKTSQVDIYALGIMLYEVLEGNCPFQGTEIEVMNQHLNEEPPEPQKAKVKTGSNSVKVILKALAKDPQQRFTTAVEFINALEDAYAKDHDISVTTNIEIATSTRKQVNIALIGLLVTTALSIIAIAVSLGILNVDPRNAKPTVQISTIIVDSETRITPTIEFLTPSSNDGSPTQESTILAPTLADPNPDHLVVAVKSDSTRLRGGPGTNYPVLAVASSGQHLDVRGQHDDSTGEISSGWYQVDFINSQQSQTMVVWVAQSLVTDISGDPSIVPPANPPPTSTPAPVSNIAVSTAVQVCNPGEWNPVCGSNNCAADHVSECNNAGTGFDCIWNPSQCSIAPGPQWPPALPPIVISTPGVIPTQVGCTQSWLNDQIRAYGESKHPPLTFDQTKTLLISQGYDRNGNGSLDCDDYRAITGQG